MPAIGKKQLSTYLPIDEKLVIDREAADANLSTAEYLAQILRARHGRFVLRRGRPRKPSHKSERFGLGRRHTIVDETTHNVRQQIADGGSLRDRRLG